MPPISAQADVKTLSLGTLHGAMEAFAGPMPKENIIAMQSDPSAAQKASKKRNTKWDDTTKRLTKQDSAAKSLSYA